MPMAPCRIELLDAFDRDGGEMVTYFVADNGRSSYIDHIRVITKHDRYYVAVQRPTGWVPSFDFGSDEVNDETHAASTAYGFIYSYVGAGVGR